MPVILGEGGPHDPNRIGLDTRLGRPITNHRRREHLPERLRDAAKIVRKNFPVRLRSLSATYSCVSLVFANRRTWVEIDQLELILTDDGYRQISFRQVVGGDVITYSDEHGYTHVGIVVATDRTPATKEQELWILSQWGQDGEYFHRPTPVHPLYGSIRKYWTERRATA